MPSVSKNFSLYTLLSLVVGAQAAVLVFVHSFGNPGVDVICGSVLGGIAVLSIVGHTWFSSLTIGVPANVFSVLQTVDGVFVTVLASGGIIVQYVGSATPALTPWVSVILQGMALIAGLFSGLFKTTATLRAAKASRVGAATVSVVS